MRRMTEGRAKGASKAHHEPKTARLGPAASTAVRLRGRSSSPTREGGTDTSKNALRIFTRQKIPTRHNLPPATLL